MACIGAVLPNCTFIAFTVPNDPRKVIIKTFAITKPGKKAIVLKIYDPNLAKTPYSMVEKEKFQVKLTFYVQHDVCLGLKYMYFVYKHGVRGA